MGLLLCLLVASSECHSPLPLSLSSKTYSSFRPTKVFVIIMTSSLRTICFDMKLVLGRSGVGNVIKGIFVHANFFLLPLSDVYISSKVFNQHHFVKSKSAEKQSPYTAVEMRQLEKSLKWCAPLGISRIHLM